jgi:hypothetical protein
MPPLGTVVRDEAAIAMLDAWITGVMRLSSERLHDTPERAE